MFLLVHTAVFAQSEDRADSDSIDQTGRGDDIAYSGAGSLGERLARTPSSADFGRRFATILRLQERGDYANALIDGRAAAEDAAASGEDAAHAGFLFLLGRTYWIVGDFPAAVETLQQQVRLSEKLGDHDLISAGQHALGVTYTQTRDYDAAERTFQEALRHAEILGDKARIAYVLNGTANNQLARREYADARSLYARALAIRESIGDRVGAADSSTNLGTIDLLTGDPASALVAYQKALAIYKSIDQPRRIARGHRRVAAALRRLGRLDEAIAELRIALAIAEPLGSAPVLAEIYHELARSHEGRGELRSTLYYERRYASTRESILGEQIRLRVIELDARFQAERRDNDIRLLRLDQEAKAAEIARRRQQTVLLSGGLALVLGLGLVVFFTQRARLRAEHAAHLADERARAEAEQAARLKSRLLQIAAHDLKAPLSAVSASARRIETRPEETAAVVDLARHIRTDAAHMGGLVREFLDSAAIEAGRLQLQRSPVDLTAITRDTVETYRSLAEAKQQSITCELPDTGGVPLPCVLADAARLRQILDNLIINALKFTPSGGRVAVVLGQSGRWLFAEVRDSGPGLKPEDLARMFQPFQSLSATPTARESSDGLGLFITQELVSMHNGLLEVESQPGQGATFRVLLPLADDTTQS
ncbi:tetratricopeptide repeat protein [Rariglobus hedericola]|uniref:histidine kinase n=1 Tax=Rariglobus hedericola TaxID=2597822 RepID=A0A556QES4_9BACT|nr:tetratricopeptide repeat protein [Rariglobus hedericola]